MVKLLFKPISLIVGFLTGKIAGELFTRIWGLVDRDRETSPHPMRRDVTTQRAVAAAVVQSATFAATRTIMDRWAYRAFEYTTGFSARPKEAKKEEKEARRKGF